jgi:hypothetical protein
MVLSSLFHLSTSSSPSYLVNQKRGEHPTDSDASSDMSDSDSTSTNRGMTSPTSTRADEDSLLTPATSTSTSGYNINGAKEDSAAATSDSTVRPSYQSIYNSPPSITYPYSPTEALGDLSGIAYALELFLSSQMLESEAFCKWGHSGLEEAQKQERIKDKKAKKKSETELEDKGHMERLYFATGYGLIQV